MLKPHARGFLDLPPPDPLHFPTTWKQVASDVLLHGAISLGTYAAVYAVTGMYAGPGHAGILWHAFFSTTEVGAVGASTNAFADTMFALSVYAEPFVAVALPVVAVASTVAALKTEQVFIDEVISSENMSNIDKAVTLGTYTNVPY